MLEIILPKIKKNYHNAISTIDCGRKSRLHCLSNFPSIVLLTVSLAALLLKPVVELFVIGYFDIKVIRHKKR